MDRWELAFEHVEKSYNQDVISLVSEITGILETSLTVLADEKTRDIENEQEREKERKELEKLYTKDLVMVDKQLNTMANPTSTKKGKKGFYFKNYNKLTKEYEDKFVSYERAINQIKSKISNSLVVLEEASEEAKQQALDKMNDLRIVKRLAALKVDRKKGSNDKEPVLQAQLEEEEKEDEKEKALRLAREKQDAKEAEDRRKAQEVKDAHMAERRADLKKRGVRVQISSIQPVEVESYKKEDLFGGRVALPDGGYKKTPNDFTYRSSRNDDGRPVEPAPANNAPLAMPETGIDVSAEAPGSYSLSGEGRPFELDGFFMFKSPENEALFKKAMAGQTDRRVTVQSGFIRWLVGAKGMKVTDMPGLENLAPAEKQRLGSEYLTFVKEHQFFTSENHTSYMPGAAEHAREYARINRKFTEEMLRVMDPMIGGDLLNEKWRREHVDPLKNYLKGLLIDKDQNEAYLESLSYPVIHNAYETEYGEEQLARDSGHLNMAQKFFQLMDRVEDPALSENERKAAAVLLGKWKERLGGKPASEAGPADTDRIIYELNGFDAVTPMETALVASGQAPRSPEVLAEEAITQGCDLLREQVGQSWQQRGANDIRDVLKYEGGYEDQLFEEAGFLFANADKENDLPYERLTREEIDKIHLVFGHTLGQLRPSLQHNALLEKGADFREGFSIDGTPVAELFRESLEGKDQKTRREILETEILRAVFDPNRKVEYRPYVYNDKMEPVPAEKTTTIETPSKVISNYAEKWPVDLSVAEKIHTVEDAKNFLEKLSKRWTDITVAAADLANNRPDVDKAGSMSSVLRDKVKNFDATIGAGAVPVSFRDALGNTSTHRFLSEAGRKTLLNTVKVVNSELFYMKNPAFRRAFTEGTGEVYPDFAAPLPGIKELTDNEAPVSAGSRADERVSAENVRLLSYIYQDLITHDPAFHWNSSEYKNMRDSLKAIHDWVNNKKGPYRPGNQDDRNQMMGLCAKAFDDAAAYIKKRGMKGVIQDYGIARRNDALAVMDVLNPQYMKSFSAELPQLSFEGRRMSYTELQKTVKEHVTELYGTDARKKAEIEKKQRMHDNAGRKDLSDTIDRVFSDADTKRKAASEGAGDPIERFRKRVDSDRAGAKTEYLQKLVLDALSEDALIDVADTVFSDPDVKDTLVMVQMNSPVGQAKKAMLGQLKMYFNSVKGNASKAFLKEAVNHLSGAEASRIAWEMGGLTYKDTLNQHIVLQAKNTHADKLETLIERTVQDGELAPEKKDRITKALMNAERHLTRVDPDDPRYFNLRRKIANELDDLDKETNKSLGDKVMEREENKAFKKSFKNFGLKHDGTVEIRTVKNGDPGAEAAAKEYLGQKFSLSDGFKGTLKDLIGTLDKEGMLVRDDQGDTDVFRKLKDAKDKLVKEIDDKNPDVMKITEASEEFEKQRALYKELYGKIGEGFSKSAVSGVTSLDVRVDLPWEFSADIKKASTLKAVFELGVFLKEKKISVDEFLEDPAKIMQDMYRQGAEKFSIETQTAEKSPAANLAELLTEKASENTTVSMRDDVPEQMPKFAALLTYGEPDQERFTHNQMVNRMVGVDAKALLYDNEKKVTTFISKATGGREDEENGGKKQPVSEKEIEKDKRKQQLNENLGTVQMYYGAFRNLAVVKKEDFDCRSMMYFSPVDKNGKEQRPFKLDEYIYTHDFDYNELAERPEKIVREYMQEASKSSNREKLPRLDVIFVKMQEGLMQVVAQKQHEVKEKDPNTKAAFRKLQNAVLNIPDMYRNVRTKLLKEAPDQYKKVFKDHETDIKISPEAGRLMEVNKTGLKQALDLIKPQEEELIRNDKSKNRINDKNKNRNIVNDLDNLIISDPKKGGKKKNGKK